MGPMFHRFAFIKDIIKTKALFWSNNKPQRQKITEMKPYDDIRQNACMVDGDKLKYICNRTNYKCTVTVVYLFQV